MRGVIVKRYQIEGGSERAPVGCCGMGLHCI
jgi:hypothetical protein